MITVKCNKCGQEMFVKGAILVSPPLEKTEEIHAKYHICILCYELLKEWFLPITKIKSDVTF